MRHWLKGHARGLALALVGAMCAMVLITPAGAHINRRVGHAWSHIKPKVLNLLRNYYTKSQSESRFLSDVQRVTTSYNVAPGSVTQSADAHCPPGKVLTGGGYDMSGPNTQWWEWQSGPLDGDTWRVRGNNASAFNVTLDVTAICAR